jgi:hypothetical protein
VPSVSQRLGSGLRVDLSPIAGISNDTVWGVIRDFWAFLYGRCGCLCSEEKFLGLDC